MESITDISILTVQLAPMRTSKHLIAVTTIIAAACAPAATASAPACAVTVPREIAGPQPRWLGACVAGKAAGVGVLRVGMRAPHSFFFGRAAAGRPQTGLVVLASGDLMQIRGLDAAGAVLAADGEHLPEQDRAWADAAAGARSVARRFAATGNARSSAFYAAWAHRIATQRPE